MWWNLVEVGGIIFWILLAILLIWEIVCVADEEINHSSILGWIAFILIIWLLGDFHLVSFSQENWKKILVFLTSYVLIGIVWSYLKWELLLAASRREFERDKEEWLLSHGVRDGVVPIHLKTNWSKHIVGRYERYWNSHRYEDDKVFLAEYTPEKLSSLVIPEVSRYKDRIIFWMSHWPASLLWALTRDLIVEIWNFIYSRSLAFLKLRSRSHFKGIEKDFGKTPQP